MANESKDALKLMKDSGCDVLDIKFIDLPGVWHVARQHGGCRARGGGEGACGGPRARRGARRRAGGRGGEADPRPVPQVRDRGRHRQLPGRQDLQDPEAAPHHLRPRPARLPRALRPARGEPLARAAAPETGAPLKQR